MRSNWKGCFSDIKVDCLYSETEDSNKFLKIWNRGSTVLSIYVGLRVLVYNGRNFTKFTVKSFMVGHKFGEYVPTKIMGKLIHERKKKK
jgi:small subunit ribosomal protein S19